MRAKGRKSGRGTPEGEETLSLAPTMADGVGRTRAGGGRWRSKGWSSPLLVPPAGGRAIAVTCDGKGMGNSFLFEVFGAVYSEPPNGSRMQVPKIVQDHFRTCPPSSSSTSYTPSHGPRCPGEGCLTQISAAPTLLSPFRHPHRFLHRCNDRKCQSAPSTSPRL